MKKKKFAEGGSSFIDDFEAAKKNKAEVVADKVADKVAPVAVPKKSEFQTAEGENKMISKTDLTRKAPRFISKLSGNSSIYNNQPISPNRLARRDILNEFPENKEGANAIQTGFVDNPKFPVKDRNEFYAYEDAGYKSGGKVKSASARADGCAIRGKTRA